MHPVADPVAGGQHHVEQGGVVLGARDELFGSVSLLGEFDDMVLLPDPGRKRLMVGSSSTSSRCTGQFDAASAVPACDSTRW